MIFQLDDDKIWFPDPRLGENDGLLAVGGDLRPERLLLAYSHGIFPWYSYRQGLIEWWCPMQRFVIFPKEIHISHSMRTCLNKGTFQWSIDQAFSDVIHHCSTGTDHRDQQNGAWLGPEMIAAYTRLNELGHAKSVEVWQDGRLVGGLYGVLVGHVFCGESMFSLVPNGSKVALIALSKLLSSDPSLLIDCQFETPHLKSMGGRHIGYEEYLKRLRGEYPSATEGEAPSATEGKEPLTP